MLGQKTKEIIGKYDAVTLKAKRPGLAPLSLKPGIRHMDTAVSISNLKLKNLNNDLKTFEERHDLTKGGLVVAKEDKFNSIWNSSESI